MIPSMAEAGAMTTFLKVSPVLACQMLWVAPFPTMQEVAKKETTEGLPPLPYFSMMANGFLWMGYGSMTMDWTIITPNATGFLAGAYYSYNFNKHNSGQFDLTPYKVGTLGSMLAVSGVIAATDPATAKGILGYAGCLVCVAMLSGPLTVMKEVLETKSTKSLPAPMAVATVLNCTLWSSFGLFIIDDPFIYVPNLLGLGSGLTQCALIAKFGMYKEPIAAPAPESAVDPNSK